MENKKKPVIEIGFMLGNLINSDYTICVIFNDKDSNHQEFYLQSFNKYCSIKCFLYWSISVYRSRSLHSFFNTCSCAH